MLIIKNAKTIAGDKITLNFPGEVGQRVLNAEGLTILPALIDPHVHFRTPGLEHKENWESAARACIVGGFTQVFDMPNTIPACTTKARLTEKKALIDQQLKAVGIPLRYGLYFGADRKHFDEIHQVNKEIVGIKVFMGASTGELLMEDDSSLHALFALAARFDLVVAVHAEDEVLLQARRAQFASRQDPAVHSEWREVAVAETAVDLALKLAEIYNVRLYLLHVSSIPELTAIREAKRRKVKVYAEACPHHLFLDTSAYETLGNLVKMNPPLRHPAHQQALWQGVLDGTIDTIGSDHAPHTLTEKNQTYWDAPSGVPNMETTLPLLLTAYHQKKLSLGDIVKLTRTNIEKLFHLPSNDDVVLVDLAEARVVKRDQLKTRCGWSPYEGRVLTGWPKYTILRGALYHA